MKNISIIFFGLIFLLFSQNSYAHLKAVSSRKMAENKRSSQATNLFSNWGLNYGTYFLYGYGQVSNDIEITPRAIDYNILGAFIDVSYKSFGIGYGYETGIIAQRKSPAELGNTNVSGYTTNGIARLSYRFNSSFLFSLNYKINDNYSLANKDALGQDVKYNLKSGIGAQLFIKTFSNFGLVLDYNKSIFSYSSYTNDINQDRLGIGIIYFN